MSTNCPLFDAHYWKLDACSYGKCACVAEKDFNEKEKGKTLIQSTMERTLSQYQFQTH